MAQELRKISLALSSSCEMRDACANGNALAAVDLASVLKEQGKSKSAIRMLEAELANGQH